MNTSVVDKNLVQAGRYGSAIKADASDSLPTRIEVMRAGTWPADSNKGALWITPDDLQEFVRNFKAGIGIPGGADFGQLPIDFNHDDDDEAAGWITDLTVEGMILYADVTWSTAGEAALKGGMYKCFSPSFWPACLGEWYDPENYAETATNVLVGGALTNIPFFKDLQAIMASNAGNSKDKHINSNAPKENIVPTLDEVRIKDVASLTDDDKKVLADNKATLSAEELKKFGLDEKTAVAASATTGVSDEDAKVLASIKSGEVKVVKASEYDHLTSTVSKLEASQKATEEKEARAFVTAQAGKGKFATSDIDKWTARVVADASLKADIEAMPAHPVLASEIGNGDENVGQTANDELNNKAQALVKADTTNTLNMQDAIRQVMASDKDLVQRLKDERK